jgi:DNA-directed RNA polymerase
MNHKELKGFVLVRDTTLSLKDLEILSKSEEEFELESQPTGWHTYKIEGGAFKYKNLLDGGFSTSIIPLHTLLSMNFRRKPWTPIFGGTYWYINVNRNGFKEVYEIETDFHCFDLHNFKMGNCFKTEEEAQTNWSIFNELKNLCAEFKR